MKFFDFFKSGEEFKHQQDLDRFNLISKLAKGSIIHLGSSHRYGREGLQGVLETMHKEIDTCDVEEGATYGFNLNRATWPIKKKYDTVIAAEIIEHLENPLQFLRNCRKLLKKGGFIIVSTPNATSLLYLRNPSWCVPIKYGHTLSLTSGMLVYHLQNTGFKNITYRYINEFWYSKIGYILSNIFSRLRSDIVVRAEAS